MSPINWSGRDQALSKDEHNHSAKTMPTKYIERKLAERIVVLLRSVGEVLVAA